MKVLGTIFLLLIFTTASEAQDYQSEVGQGDWVDITDDAVMVIQSDFDDYTTEPIPIGFDFIFYNQDYSTLNFNSNGFISFSPELIQDGGNDDSETNLPSTEGPNNIIALFWDDLANEIHCGTAAWVGYQTSGEAPNRRFTLTYYHALLINDAIMLNCNNYISVQVHLHETTNEINIVFGDNTTPSNASAVTGIENLDASLGIETFKNEVISSGTSIRYFIPDVCEGENRWTGVLTSEWDNPGNWSEGHIPCENESVIIPQVLSPAQTPIIGSYDVLLRSLELEVGSTLKFKGLDANYFLSIKENLTVDGILNHQGTALIKFTNHDASIVSGGGNWLSGKMLVESSSVVQYDSEFSFDKIIIEELSDLRIEDGSINVKTLIKDGVISGDQGELVIESDEMELITSNSNWSSFTGNLIFESGDSYPIVDQFIPEGIYNYVILRANGNNVNIGSYSESSIFASLVIEQMSPLGEININAELNLNEFVLGSDHPVHIIFNNIVLFDDQAGLIVNGNSDNHFKFNSSLSSFVNTPNQSFLLGTVEYTADNNQNISDLNYDVLRISGSGEKSVTTPIYCKNLDLINTSFTSINDNWVNVSRSVFVAEQDTSDLNFQLCLNGEYDQMWVVPNLIDGFKIYKPSSKLNLLNNLNINARIQLSEGVIETGDNLVYLKSGEANALSASSSAYINGGLRRSILSEGFFSFPIGDESQPRKAIVENKGLSGNGFSTLTARFTSFSEDFNITLLEDSYQYNELCSEGIWKIDANVEPIEGEYDIQLFIDGFQDLSDNQFGVLKRPSGGSVSDWSTGNGLLNDEGESGRILADGFAERLSLKSFSEFSIARFQTMEVSPDLELINFTSECINDHVDLTWSTSSEIETDFFEITKTQAGEMVWIKTVSANSNSSDFESYSIFDEDNNNGFSTFYDLKVYYTDGNYSEIGMNQEYCGATDDHFEIGIISVIHNQNMANISIQTIENELFELSLFDVSGREVSWVSGEGSPEPLNELVNLPSESGVYFINLKTSRGMDTFKFAIQ